MHAFPNARGLYRGGKWGGGGGVGREDMALLELTDA